DALNPELYPDIVSSVAFSTELFDVPVQAEKDSLKCTLYEYLSEHQRKPWWSAVTGFPFKCLGWVMSLFRDEEKEGENGKVDPFRLTKEESGIVKALNGRISVSVDKKTMVITLGVTMQDPLIAATLTDTVMSKLQAYITDYRTNKARHDLAFTQKLYDEARA
ncbi:chain-length determining protein, partial [Mediterranea massiliensis]|nr:chain-length determining protein [Mediterranea massiliensis]